MKLKVAIESKLFEFEEKYSSGLISGIICLYKAGAIIIVDNSNISSLAIKTLKSENILTAGFEDLQNGDNLFFIGNTRANKINHAKVLEPGIDFDKFSDAVKIILKNIRSGKIERKTKETDIFCEIYLDGDGKSQIQTGLNFFNHMLEQIARHANVDLTISAKGDLEVDEHHTVEDVGIALGEAIKKAIGEKRGIKRYGFFLPMDDSIAECAIDLGGRSYLNFNCKFKREKVGDFPLELTEEFFRSLANGMQANIFIKADGKNEHHKVESIFKAFAKSLNEAFRIDERANNSLPTTKGIV